MPDLTAGLRDPSKPHHQVLCTDCDGVGWTGGGETLQTTCAVCKGTGALCCDRQHDDPIHRPESQTDHRFESWWAEDGGYWAEGDPPLTAAEREMAERAWKAAWAKGEEHWKDRLGEVETRWEAAAGHVEELLSQRDRLRVALEEIARKGNVGPPDPSPDSGWYNLAIRLSAIAREALDG